MGTFDSLYNDETLWLHSKITASGKVNVYSSNGFIIEEVDLNVAKLFAMFGDYPS